MLLTDNPYYIKPTEEDWERMRPGARRSGFSGNPQQWLSDPRNAADLDAVLTGKAIIVRLNPKAT